VPVVSMAGSANAQAVYLGEARALRLVTLAASATATDCKPKRP
jgi:hypothetical protein